MEEAMSINIYEMVNQKIIEMLEQGTIPWRKPWNAETNMPRNIVSGKEYRGVNTFLLGCQSYGSPYWMTFKQCQEKGGHVRKGEKSSIVVFWKWLDRKSADTGEASEAGEPNRSGKIPLLRYYNVFNWEQTEEIPEPPKQEAHNIFTPIERAEQIVTGMPLRPQVRHGGGKAAYSPTLDYIKMPEKHTFSSSEAYYATLLHELSHSTGHEKRLNRKSLTEMTGFGSHDYAREELVAEMSAAFLCAYAGIEQSILDNSAAYIAGWLKALKNDKTMLVMAAAQGQKSADYILNKQEEQQLDEAA
jgi:antirestriction protein ArdC